MHTTPRCQFCGRKLISPSPTQKFCVTRPMPDGSEKKSYRCKQGNYDLNRRPSDTRSLVMSSIRQWQARLAKKVHKADALRVIIAKATAALEQHDIDIDLLSQAIVGTAQTVLPFGQDVASGRKTSKTQTDGG